MKFVGGIAGEQVATLKKVNKTTLPHSPFSYFFMDSEYNKQYKADDRFQQVFGALTGFAMLISCCRADTLNAVGVRTLLRNHVVSGYELI